MPSEVLAARDLATVGMEHLFRHIGGVIRREKRGGNFGRRPYALHRNVTAEALNIVGVEPGGNQRSPEKTIATARLIPRSSPGGTLPRNLEPAAAPGSRFRAGDHDKLRDRVAASLDAAVRCLTVFHGGHLHPDVRRRHRPVGNVPSGRRRDLYLLFAHRTLLGPPAPLATSIDAVGLLRVLRPAIHRRTRGRTTIPGHPAGGCAARGRGRGPRGRRSRARRGSVVRGGPSTHAGTRGTAAPRCTAPWSASAPRAPLPAAPPTPATTAGPGGTAAATNSSAAT